MARPVYYEATLSSTQSQTNWRTPREFACIMLRYRGTCPVGYGFPGAWTAGNNAMPRIKIMSPNNKEMVNLRIDQLINWANMTANRRAASLAPKVTLIGTTAGVSQYDMMIPICFPQYSNQGLIGFPANSNIQYLLGPGANQLLDGTIEYFAWAADYPDHDYLLTQSDTTINQGNTWTFDPDPTLVSFYLNPYSLDEMLTIMQAEASYANFGNGGGIMASNIPLSTLQQIMISNAILTPAGTPMNDQGIQIGPEFLTNTYPIFQSCYGPHETPWQRLQIQNGSNANITFNEMRETLKPSAASAMGARQVHKNRPRVVMMNGNPTVAVPRGIGPGRPSPIMRAK